MHLLIPYTLLIALLASVVESYGVHPFHVALSHGVQRMNDLVENYRVPPALPPIANSITPTYGIDADWLQTLRNSWLNDFDWESRQDYMNSFNHYTADIEGLNIHFVHAKSTAPPGIDIDIIPIILSHGWPGSFLEFLPIISTLTQANTLKSGKNVSFDVVIPSLPGFAFSAPPPPVWTVNDTARVWNTLMVDVLNYTSGYSVAGTDWGALINWCLLNDYPHAKAAHFNFLAIVPPSLESLIAAGAQLNDFERAGIESAQVFFQSGTAYFMVHQTRPWTLGLAMVDTPMGQLAWIAEKYHDWSDPSLIDMTLILTTVSLYYLTESFPTSLFVYAQNTGFSSTDVRAVTNKPFGYSAFQWEGIRHPEVFVRGLGNLTFYKENFQGGHFAPSEQPVAYADDLIEMMGSNFPTSPSGAAAAHGTSKLFGFGFQGHMQNILRTSL